MSQGGSVELDYAFLASWAGIQADGTLTAVGMSFLRVEGGKAGGFGFAVAGRVRFRGDCDGAQLGITLVPPDGPVNEFTDMLVPSDGAAYGDNRRQVLFALNTTVTARTAGTWGILLTLNQETVRELFFEVAEG